ncbi:MAG: pyruvate kinase [Deltaproteobacteria bacterium]|nr:pyruvate kinase [Deltaproteobacteria bacterium]
MIRRTKIVATLGPASEKRDKIRTLMEMGVDVFRLNFSHGTQAQKTEIIQIIREEAEKQLRVIAILGDLQGPKIRTGLMENGELELLRGQEVTITTREELGKGDMFSTTYKNLPQDVCVGDRILLDDGNLELTVVRTGDDEVGCRVEVGGVLRDHKGINLPGSRVSAPAVTDKDKEDLTFCIGQGVDYLGQSFVRRVEDIREMRALMAAQNASIPIIAKIEKPQALEDFEAILAEVDAVMVARGDLGVEMNPEKVPLIQKRIIRSCNKAGKPVITATQMLESMIYHPRPTRAETSDIANAIIDGSDAVMLSGETAVGKYAIEAVKMMGRVADDVEKDPILRERIFSPVAPQEGDRSLPEIIAAAACEVAENAGASAILAFTQTGSTAALVAKYRPGLPVFAVTPSAEVERRLVLFRGVRSLRVETHGDTETQIASLEKAVLEAGVLHQGDIVVITMGSPVPAAGTTNLIKVQRLGG